MGNRTPLFDRHQAMGGKIVDFGGWDMPLHYGSQMEEHHQVRKAAGMFDVSHMTIVDIDGEHAKPFLQYLLANDVGKLDGKPGKALYSGMLNHDGGVVDDLIVYNREGHFLREGHYRLIVNCATREKDLDWIRHISADYDVEISERPHLAMIAVQGPEARAKVTQVLPQFAEGIEQLSVFQALEEKDWFIGRTGYTGEDGLEILMPDEQAATFWQALADVGVAPCGLGARDTLRLEAGMNLYGHEMDEQTSPLVANMGWTIAWIPEQRDFVGRQAVTDQKAAGVQDKLVGLTLTSRGVLRAGQKVRVNGSECEGVITSGSFSPTLGHSIALARIPVDADGEAEVELRGKWVNVAITKPAFVRHGQSII
ncbi:glycine cleavage system aminomethyltransferase GcvT [Marinimicrobium agarilyticum]|uniref:glycine cleavage system aminomethyltransferase GcvT n=1 Tax=Marinimicrobium agarilyticum TaxID=306546 RepID=UPI0004140B35|nr:glycine cleavage system aminomethyltransferase GcvT [Marinimicrobium agarilyticum]